MEVLRVAQIPTLSDIGALDDPDDAESDVAGLTSGSFVMLPGLNHAGAKVRSDPVRPLVRSFIASLRETSPAST